MLPIYRSPPQAIQPRFNVAGKFSTVRRTTRTDSIQAQKEEMRVVHKGIPRQTLCLEDKSRNAILLLVLGSAYFLHHGLAWCSDLIGLNLDPTFGVNPYFEAVS